MKWGGLGPKLLTLYMMNRFNLGSTAAGIACQFSAEQSKSVVSVSKVHPAVMKPLISRKKQKARLTFAEEHVVLREENLSKISFSDASKL